MSELKLCMQNCYVFCSRKLEDWEVLCSITVGMKRTDFYNFIRQVLGHARFWNSKDSGQKRASHQELNWHFNFNITVCTDDFCRLCRYCNLKKLLVYPVYQNYYLISLRAYDTFYVNHFQKFTFELFSSFNHTTYQPITNTRNTSLFAFLMVFCIVAFSLVNFELGPLEFMPSYIQEPTTDFYHNWGLFSDRKWLAFLCRRGHISTRLLELLRCYYHQIMVERDDLKPIVQAWTLVSTTVKPGYKHNTLM